MTDTSTRIDAEKNKRIAELEVMLKRCVVAMRESHNLHYCMVCDNYEDGSCEFMGLVNQANHLAEEGYR